MLRTSLTLKLSKSKKEIKPRKGAEGRKQIFKDQMYNLRGIKGNNYLSVKDGDFPLFHIMTSSMTWNLGQKYVCHLNQSLTTVYWNGKCIIYALVVYTWGFE